MRVAVTGAAGFLGGHLTAELLGAGHQVVGITRAGGPALSSLPGEQRGRYAPVRADARLAARLAPVLAGCDQVVLLAAKVGGVTYLGAHRYDVGRDSARLTAAGLDAALRARRAGRLRRVLLVSSCHVYGKTSLSGAREGDELRRCPPTSYGLHKLAAEMLVRDAHAQHGLPFTIVRPFNCVGLALGGRCDGGGRLLPDLVAGVRRGGPLTILGSGGQTRNYIHARDVARGIRLCLEHDAAIDEDFNLTSGQPTTVLDVARLVWRRLRSDPFRHRSLACAALDLTTNVGCGRKAADLLGFRALVPLDAVVDEVAGASLPPRAAPALERAPHGGTAP
jgi:UDP-glucose 4-epimerase